MAAPDWETIKQIFSEALNVPAPVRDAYVERACDGRAEVHRAVTELLRAHTDASQTFLEPDSIVVRAAWLFPPGECIAGRFRVVKPIARGAMGEVYQVQDERLRLSVALKAIRPELLSDAESVERFRREVLVTRDIAHDGLCRVFDLIEHPMPPQTGFPAGTVVPCLTMQLLEGVNLDDWLAAHRPMPVAEAMPLVRQIADALQVLHDAGVVHRDLKPSNVMLVQSGTGMRAVLTDFGLAKPLEERLFETQGSGFGGAPYFMAPELLRGGRPSLASDIYALGLLIDEMVTQTRAFSADSLHGLMLQKLADGPARPSLRSDGLPKSWERTILRCLAPDPRDRFPSTAAVMAAIAPVGSFWRDRLRLEGIVPAYIPRKVRIAAYSIGTTVALTGAISLNTSRLAPPPPSVIVMPFANLTGQAENNYLSAGTASEFGRRLSSLDGWRVYMPKEQALQVESAPATFAVTGHVQEVDGTLRITAELTDTRNGTLLWSQRFDGSREKALELEDRLASAALGALRTAAHREDDSALSRAVTFARTWKMSSRSRQLPTHGTSNNEAFDAYMRGRYLSEERTLASTLAAIDLFRRAVTLDPAFAASYAGLADAQSVLMDLHHAPHDKLLADREQYANQAVALDPTLPETQLALAAVRQMQSRWDEAETAYKRALELHPAFSRAHRSYGGMLLQFGRFNEAVDLCKRALELDPYDIPNHSAYGLVLFYARRPLEAAQHLEELVAQRDHVHAHMILGQVYSQLAAIAPSGRGGYLKKALQQVEFLRQKRTAATDRYADLVGALAWSYQGDVHQAQPFLQSLEAGRAEGRVSPSFPARVYAVQHRATDAIETLQAAAVERDRELMYLAVSPLYDSIRNEPQFRALMKRLQLIE